MLFGVWESQGSQAQLGVISAASVLWESRWQQPQEDSCRVIQSSHIWESSLGCEPREGKSSVHKPIPFSIVNNHKVMDLS